MLVVIVYDIDMSVGKDDMKRLRHIAEICERYGTRVQNSVFEIIVDYTQYKDFRNKIKGIIDCSRDSVRYYVMGNKWQGKVEYDGICEKENASSLLIV